MERLIDPLGRGQGRCLVMPLARSLALCLYYLDAFISILAACKSYIHSSISFLISSFS
jgi:hypothetical protein